MIKEILPHMAWGGRWLLASCREAGLEILVLVCKERVTWVERRRQWFTCGSVPGLPALHTSKHSLKQIVSPGCQSWDLVISKWHLVKVFGAGHLDSNLLSLWKPPLKLGWKYRMVPPGLFLQGTLPVLYLIKRNKSHCANTICNEILTIHYVYF